MSILICHDISIILMYNNHIYHLFFLTFRTQQFQRIFQKMTNVAVSYQPKIINEQIIHFLKALFMTIKVIYNML